MCVVVNKFRIYCHVVHNQFRQYLFKLVYKLAM